ncbi:MAG: ketopantoate reductase family protein [Immundisolibacteraceae bacterium]|nr:ketopantoate reductase family protein [Immundisolibacteraceae bacterium]
MKIAVVGVGGLGSLFAGRLCEHADVTLVARGKRLKQLREQGITVKLEQGCEHYAADRFQILDSELDSELSRLAGIDFLIFTCKTQQTGPLAQLLVKHVSAACQIVSLQNGVDNEMVLAEAFNRPVIGAMTVRFGSHLNSDGSVGVVGELISRFGVYPTGINAPVAQLVAVMEQAGFTASQSEDICLESWKKMVINCACNPVSALLPGDIQSLYQSEPTRWIMVNIMREAAAAAAADGVEITPQQLNQLADMLANMPPLKSSMQVDAERGTPLELDGLTGAIMSRAAQLGQEALVTASIHHLLLAKYPNAAV